MSRFKSSLTILKFVAATLVVLTVSRTGLALFYFDRIGSGADLVTVLLHGIRVDLVIVAYFYSIPLLVTIWFSTGRVTRIVALALKLWMFMAFGLITFMEVVTPQFILEYDIRPNRLFFDYLIYPGEVFSMLWKGYKPAIFFTAVAVGLTIIVARQLARGMTSEQKGAALLKKLGVSLIVLLISFFAGRSSLQHRPFNPSMVYFSNDNMVNSLVLNSSYSVLYAAYNTGSEEQAADLYGRMNDSEVIAGVRQATVLHGQPFKSDEIPTLRFHPASHRGQPRNIVILLQESLGARYVGSLGGKDLTPNLDSLMADGWSFTNAYATGTRSVRGIEAVFTGFSPGPSRSVVKLSKSQDGFFSLASLLQRHEYFTQFIYGGESHFDNMKSFFLGNGVDDIRDLSTFDRPQFVGSWGASDQDLYSEAHRQFTALNKKATPFFSLVFTTSNHSPWEFPETCSADYTGNVHSRENAVRYSDCALGEFIQKAKSAEYWKDTLFLVIADHDSRVHGSDMVPIDHFRIPALILGGGISPRADDRMVSQIDFPTTLLSLAGIADSHPMLGFDLTRDIPSEKLRAPLQYGENFCWLNADHAIVLRPNLPPSVYSHNGQNLLRKMRNDDFPEEIRVAKANALWSSLAYSKYLYRLPDVSRESGVTRSEVNPREVATAGR